MPLSEVASNSLVLFCAYLMNPSCASFLAALGPLRTLTLAEHFSNLANTSLLNRLIPLSIFESLQYEGMNSGKPNKISMAKVDQKIAKSIPLVGLEPTTSALSARRSNQLSYSGDVDIMDLDLYKPMNIGIAEFSCC